MGRRGNPMPVKLCHKIKNNNNDNNKRNLLQQSQEGAPREERPRKMVEDQLAIRKI